MDEEHEEAHHDEEHADVEGHGGDELEASDVHDVLARAGHMGERRVAREDGPKPTAREISRPHATPAGARRRIGSPRSVSARGRA